MRSLFFVLVLCIRIQASDWYISASATSGDGSLGNPWSQTQAFASGATLAGDTVYIRAGTYQTFIVRVGMTVRNYPGERVIVTDTIFGTLGTAMTAGSPSSITITNSETFGNASVIGIDNENIQITTGSSPTNWNVTRGWNGTVAASHSAGASVWPFGRNIITITATNAVLAGLEVTSCMTTNRAATRAFYPGAGIHANPPAKGTKVFNCEVYNTGHPGIWFAGQGAGGELNGNLCWGNGIYDFAEGDGTGQWVRGSAFYCQNVSGDVYIDNNITFRNFTSGCSMFGETAAVEGFHYRSNINFSAGVGEDVVHVQSGSTPATNDTVEGNFLMGKFVNGYQSQRNRLQNFYKNTLIGTLAVGNTIAYVDTISGVVTGNTFFVVGKTADDSTVLLSTPNIDQGELALTWDRNTYYFRNASFPNQFGYDTRDVDAPFNVKFDVLTQPGSVPPWTNWSGYDINSTYATAWPTNIQMAAIRKTDYDTNRLHICVINTDTNTTNATVSMTGWNLGDSFILRDAQNYFNPIISAGIWNGVSINLPLNRTNVSDISGTLTHYTNQHTNVRYPGLFNAFVIERQAPAFGDLTFQRGTPKLRGIRPRP